MLSLNPARGGMRMGEGRSCIQKRASILKVKSCQRWMLDKDWRYRSASKRDCVCHTQHISRFLFQLLRSLGCSPERVRVCVCKKERKSESCLCCRFLFIKYSHSHLYASAASSLPLSSLSSAFLPRSLTLSLPRSLAHFPLSTSCLYLLPGC